MKIAIYLSTFLMTLLAFPLVEAQADDAALPAGILVPGEDWGIVADNIGFADGASADADGNFYFSDLHKPSGIFKLTPDGKKTTVSGEGMSGTKIGPDGRLYGCGGGKVIAVDLASGKQTVLAENLKTNDLAVDHLGHIYVTETGKKQVTFVDAKTGEAYPADVGINKPNGIGFLPDQHTLLVSDYGGLNVWAFTVQPDGKLTDKRAFATMRAPEKKPDVAGGDGMTIDTEGRAYVTTAIGLQIFNAKGALLGVLPKPQDGALTNAAFAGINHDYLYVTCGNKVFRRKTQAKGALAFLAPTDAK